MGLKQQWTNQNHNEQILYRNKQMKTLWRIKSANIDHFNCRWWRGSRPWLRHWMITGSRLGCENKSKGYFVYFHTCENKKIYYVKRTYKKVFTLIFIPVKINLPLPISSPLIFFSLIWGHLFHLTVYECRFRWEAILWASYWILEKYGVEV